MTLPPGCSSDLTSLAATKSVMAVATIGVPLAVVATAWAAGVATAKISLSLLETKRVAMLCRFDWSPWAFWKSILMLTPSL